MTVKDFSQIEHIIQEIDRLITEMSHLRSQVAALNKPTVSLHCGAAPGQKPPTSWQGPSPSQTPFKGCCLLALRFIAAAGGGGQVAIG
jgi:hypothetical protein